MLKNLTFFDEALRDAAFEPSYSSRFEDEEGRCELAFFADGLEALIVLAHGNVCNGLTLSVGKLTQIEGFINKTFVLVVGCRDNILNCSLESSSIYVPKEASGLGSHRGGSRSVEKQSQLSEACIGWTYFLFDLSIDLYTHFSLM